MVLLKLRENLPFFQIVTIMPLTYPSTLQLNLFEDEAVELVEGKAAIEQVISLYNSKKHLSVTRALKALKCLLSLV